MSRLTGKEVYSLMDAYQQVYAPQELTEEQIWEGVENWVNSLLEEGYDLSDYTWEEMYENYITENPALLAPAIGSGAAPYVLPALGAAALIKNNLNKTNKMVTTPDEERFLNTGSFASQKDINKRRAKKAGGEGFGNPPNDDAKNTESTTTNVPGPTITGKPVKTEKPKVDPPKVDPPKVEPPKVEPPVIPRPRPGDVNFYRNYYPYNKLPVEPRGPKLTVTTDPVKTVKPVETVKSRFRTTDELIKAHQANRPSGQPSGQTPGQLSGQTPRQLSGQLSGQPSGQSVTPRTPATPVNSGPNYLQRKAIEFGRGYAGSSGASTAERLGNVVGAGAKLTKGGAEFAAKNFVSRPIGATLGLGLAAGIGGGALYGLYKGGEYGINKYKENQKNKPKNPEQKLIPGLKMSYEPEGNILLERENSISESPDWNSVPKPKGVAVLTLGNERKVFIPGQGWQFPATARRWARAQGYANWDKIPNPSQPPKPTKNPPVPPTTKNPPVPPTTKNPPVPPTTKNPPVPPTQKPPVVPTQKPPVVPTQKPPVVPTQKPPVVPTQKPPVVPPVVPPAQTGNRDTDLTTWANANKGMINSVGTQQQKDILSAVESGNPLPKAPTSIRDQVKNMQRIRMQSESTAYDIVLDYLISTNQVDTLEEAHYVMMQLDSEYIGNIVEAWRPVENLDEKARGTRKKKIFTHMM